MAYRINSRCSGCNACARQCPTRAIRGVMHGRYRVDAGLCIDCGVCGMICDDGAVEDELGHVAPRVPRGDRLRPVVEPTMCNGCGICIAYCPFACLELEGALNAGIAILVEPLACVSCRECVEICMKDAIAMRPLDLDQFDPADDRARARTLLDDYLEAAK